MTARLTKDAARPSWFHIQASAQLATTDIYIYDEIGLYGVTARDFSAALRGVTTPSITLRLNTPGGDVFDGLAIYNSLKKHGAVINVQVDGLAASIGSVIAMAGSTITMGQSAFLMVHNPWSLVVGNAADMRSMADTLDKIANSLATVYASRATVTQADALGWMNAETWFTAEEAKAAGLADGIFSDAAPVAAHASRFDLSNYKHVPAALHVAASTPDEGPVPPSSSITPDDCSRRHRARLALVQRGEFSNVN